MKFFYKNEVCKRVLSMVLAFVMIFTMFVAQLPSGLLEVQAAETYDVTIHWDNSVNNWSKVNIWAWNKNNSSENYSGGNWPGVATTANNNNAGWYDYSVSGVSGSELGIIFNNGSAQTDDLFVKLTEGTEIWVSGGKSNPTISYTAPANWKFDVTVHYYNSEGWTSLNAYMWKDTVTTIGAWPGKEITASAEKNNWYEITVEDVTTGTYGFIFNGAGGQTSDLTLTVGAGSTEYWFVGKDTTPYTSEPSVEEKEYNITVHYYNKNNWSKVYAYGGEGDSWDEISSVPGYKSWPGISISENTDHENWYDLEITKSNNSKLWCIFNNDSGSQTGDIPVEVTGETVEYWYGESETLATTMPESWNGTVTPEEPSTYDVTLYWQNTENWETVAAWVWNTTGNLTGGQWPGKVVSPVEGKDGWYGISFENITDSNLNFIFNNNDKGAQTDDLSVTLTEDYTEVWVTGGTAASKDTISTTAPEGWIPEEPNNDVVLHWYNGVDNWTTVNAYTWDSADTRLTGDWPGTEIYENAEHTDWYDVTVEDFTDATLNFIFNNGSAQTKDLCETFNDSVREVWVTGGSSNPTVHTEAPDLWTNPSAGETYTGDVILYVHYTNPSNWSTVNLYTWNTSNDNVPTNGTWPGTAMKADAGNAGWYTSSVFFANASQAGYIFNNGSTQTADATVDFTAETMHLWVDGNNATTTAPEGWVYTEVEDVETSSLYARDVMEVKIGDEVYPMSVFTGGVFETVVNLEKAATATLYTNGTVTDKTVEVEAGEVAIRLTDEGLTAEPVKSVALVGNFSEKLGADCVDWDPTYVGTEMTYLGNGFYIGTIEFPATTTDVIDVQYKVAFNDSWDYSIGSTGVNGSNVVITVPAGTTSLTVLVDEKAAKLYDDVSMSDIKVNGADKNPLTTTVSLIGTVRGGDDWNTSTKGYEFARISDTLYRYEMTLDKGSHSYKAVFDYSDWYNIEGSGNQIITLTEDDVKVVFLYDTTSGHLYDTVNEESTVASLLGMRVKPAEMEIIENANGTATFVAVANAGQKVTLYYGEKAEVEANGASALTKVTMGAVSNGKSSSEELWLGDAALDLVYYYEISGTRTLDGSNPTVTIGGAEYSNYARPAYEGRVINVPGTFPGPSWDATSNQMTYEGNRIYSYTFKNVPAAKYEFKIAVNGSWAENYGADGAFEGANISVAVPKAQDVTIYYSDVTHRAVNSIDYIFADVTLTGTGVPAGIKLTDDGLTGYYSATVTLPAGTYSDLAIDCDGTKYEVSEFTLKAQKDVTFCIDPVSSIFYHNASDVKIETANIYFDSKDTEYKSAFGAIATGEEVTFTLATGTDVTSASLLIKGSENKSVAMAKAGEAVDGVQKWSTTVSLSTIGEYTYYFVVSNGSSVLCYCDDDGYYGTGIVSELTSVKPYDLVVYRSDFETPDWMKNAVIYQIFPDRFYDGDASNNLAQTTARGDVDYEFIEDWYTLPENPEQEELLSEETYKATGAYYGDGNWSNEIYGGDLEGITERIDYLKALGVTVIYLNPVFSSISNHRYDACDYTEIDPILGTEGDFAELVKVAEENGMKVVLDGVFNHVSDDSIYFDRYYKFIDDGLDTIGAYPYWAFVYDYMAENDVDEATAEVAAKEYFTAEYGITDYSYTEWFEVYTEAMTDGNGNPVYDTIGQRTDKPVYGYEGWWGYDSMPVIKSTNGSEFQTGNWAEEIIYNEDGTSVTQYWISQGMDGWRLDVANEVSDETWQNFRESVKSLDSEAVIIGEIWNDATKYILGDMYDSVMNYMFRTAVTNFAMGTDAEATTKEMEKLRERYPEEAFYAMMNLVGSHDTTRILSYLDGISDDRNQKDIDSAFPTYEGTSNDAKQRQYLVAFLQFTYAGAPTIYYGDEIGMVGSDDPDDRRTFEWGKGNEELVTYYATLAEVREQYAALRTGSVEAFSTGNSNVLGYVRRDANDTLVVLANNGASTATVTLNLAELDVEADVLVDVLGSGSYEVSGDTVKVTVASRRGVVLTDDGAVIEIKVDKEALAPAYDESYVVPVVSERPYDKEEPSTGNTDNSGNNSNTENSGNAGNSVVTPEVPVLPTLPTTPNTSNRPNRTEDDSVRIEDMDTPLADGQIVEDTVVEEAVTEEETVVEDTQLEETEVPLTSGESTNTIPLVIVLVALLAACGVTVVVLLKKKIVK